MYCHIFVQLFSVIEKHNNEFVKTLLGQFFGAHHTQ